MTDQYSALLQRDQITSDSGLWGRVEGVLMHLAWYIEGGAHIHSAKFLKASFLLWLFAKNGAAS